MADDSRSRDRVRVEVVGSQFRHEGEEYLRGDELEVEEWQLESYAGRLERVEEADDVGDDGPGASVETEDASGDTVTVDESASSTAEEVTVDSSGSDELEDAELEEASDEEPVVDPHPSDLTNEELEDRVGEVDDVELLRAIREAEVDGKDRTGAKDAIDDRLDELEG